MKIVHLKHKDIDKVRWDAAIKKASNGNPYALSWYLDIVSPEWEALISPDYATVMPLTVKKKMGFNYLCQPPFSQQLGIFGYNSDDALTIQSFLNILSQMFNLIEINFNEANHELPSDVLSKPNDTYFLDLEAQYADITSRYSNNLKRNIKKAEKAGLTICENNSIEKLINIFRKHKGKHIKTLNNDAYKKLSEIARSAIEKGCGKILEVYTSDDKEPCGGAFFMSDEKRTVFLFSALTEKGKKNAAMPFLIDEYISQVAGEKRILDFEGSNQKNLARFYKSFGTKKNIYFQICYYKFPYIVRPFLKMYKKIKPHF